MVFLKEFMGILWEFSFLESGLRMGFRVIFGYSFNIIFVIIFDYFILVDDFQSLCIWAFADATRGGMKMNSQ